MTLQIDVHPLLLCSTKKPFRPDKQEYSYLTSPPEAALIIYVLSARIFNLCRRYSHIINPTERTDNGTRP